MRGTQTPEKRLSRRFSLKLPIAVTTARACESSETENISSGGVLFHVDQGIALGSSVSFSIRMPAKDLGVPRDVLVNGTGRVVRCSHLTRGDAVAVVIDDYDFERC